MTVTQRLTLSVTVVLLLLAPLTGALATGSTCEGCGLTHDNPIHGGTITLTDWQTNQSYTYQSLACAVEALRSDHEWARARWTGPEGTEFTLTRAEGRWDATPTGAVAFSVQGDDCESIVALASQDELERWFKRHGNPAHSDPIDLAAFGDADPAAPSIDTFNDVPVRHWASEAVEVSADAGLLTGNPDGSFHGEREVTRYEMAIILQRLLHRLDVADADEAGAELATAIRAELAESGASEDEVEEIVQIAADPDVPTPPAVPSGAAQWPDVPADHWAAEAVGFATATGFMNGYPDGQFRGEESLSRYEIAVILRRLINGTGIQPQPAVAGAASTGPLSVGQPAGQDAPGAPAADRPADPREAFLQRLRDAGFSADQAQRALAAMQGEYEETAQVQQQAQAPAPRTQQQRQAAADASRPAARETAPRTTTPGLLGQSGLLVTPGADTLGAGEAALSASTLEDGDVRTFGIGAGLTDSTEVTATITSGDIEDAILLNARQRVYSSDDGRTRAAVGILDATDEIDSTVYGVISRDTDRRTTVNAGLGGGDLLDGLFLSGERWFSDNTSAILEWMDIGDEDDINAGLSHRLSTDLNLKAGVVDGDFAGSLSLGREF